jgi:hypothetical protein
MSERPKRVVRAQIAGDKEALARMGRAGAKKAAEGRQARRAEDAAFDELRAERDQGDMRRVADERHDYLLPEES